MTVTVIHANRSMCLKRVLPFAYAYAVLQCYSGVAVRGTFVACSLFSIPTDFQFHSAQTGQITTDNDKKLSTTFLPRQTLNTISRSTSGVARGGRQVGARASGHRQSFKNAFRTEI